jgi:ubiquinone biosynthesis protein UbiJ
MFVQRIAGLLNRALADSQRARQLCATLAGRALRVEITGSPWAAVIRSDGRALALQVLDQTAGSDATADATVAGTPLALLALAGTGRRAVIQRGDAHISGDGEIAEQFSELAALLRPDVEHELGALIGQVPAHLLMRAAQHLGHWGRSTAEATLRNSADYLAHERRDLVPQPEAEHVLRGIEQLREQLDRLDASLGALEGRTQSLATNDQEAHR